jgi:hypothetical protein
VRRPGDLEGDKGVILAPKPPDERRVGFMLAMEGQRWMVSMGGWLGTRAPSDPQGFVEFARSLTRPDIYEVIKRAEPLTDAVSYTFPSNLRRRYEHYTRFPQNYLVIGDAICSFNPLYGQGMSVATLEAVALQECLRQAPSCNDLWRPFFKAAGRVVDGPWMIAAGSDFAFTGVTGARPAGNRLINWYMERVHKAASTDRLVCRAFFDVANLMQPPTTLFRPPVMARVWRECRSSSKPPATGPEPGVDAERVRPLETH